MELDNEYDETKQASEQKELSPQEQLDFTADSVYITFLYLKRLKADSELRSLQMARAPNDYYTWNLEKRKEFLGAPSIHALTKTIIMKNSEYNDDYASDPYYPRFIAVIVQYSKKLISQNIATIMKNYQRDHNQDKSKHIGKKYFKYRLADEEDAYRLTGYKYNSITPFFMQDDSLRIILSEGIHKLNPAYFWLGGGRVELKMGVSVEEFMQYFGDRVIIGNIS